ncbi:hypothetical protein [Planomonospora parontospora]|uniref:hypothetical protein n=1 Tax=Planomonospora parontospora TaxID=58119 RepID=UPI0016712E4F|nr:hypothetical protein [Planomonospora parontospora]GGL56083.1 hypothetical protein GCM10014719_66760 [Planomonospora parontospora subsp. antibiotica]GII19143.1 hypothetical protein Ppa05_58690 [Planomonospora parontospora subsp. antibiotica]
MSGSGGGQTLGGYGLNGPGVSFSDEKLKALGKDYDTHAGTIEGVADRTKAIGVPFPGFGVLGAGLHIAHDRARDSAADALGAGRDVLASWRTALETASHTYKAAEDANGLPDLPGTDLPGGGLPGGLPGGGLPGTDLPGGGLPGGGLPGGGLPGGGLPGGGLPGGGLPGGGLPGGGLPGGGLPGGGLPGGGLPGGGLPGGGLPGGGLPGTDLPGANLPGANLPGTGGVPGSGGLDGQVPGLPGQTATGLPGLGSVDPRRTDLSAYTPGEPSVPQFKVPEATTWTGDQTGTGTAGRGGGAFPAGAGTGGPGGLPGGARGAGANGMPMMPMVPMGGAGAGDQERERDQTTWLSEDEGVWGGDEDVAPSVIGQEP